MKKLILLLGFLFLSNSVFASLSEENRIQSLIDSTGTNILNKNKIQQRIIFVYNKQEKKKLLSKDKTLTDRQIVIYDGLYQYVQSEDELASLLSREISTAIKSYSGMWGGRIDSVQVFLAPKKFETVADKRAVDYMVRAGYNPLALITFINKSCPQKHSDLFGRHNLTSKRLARIYEYITYKYPQYLNSSYVENKYYQNFLLNSVGNRQMLNEKIRLHSTEELKYE